MAVHDIEAAEQSAPGHREVVGVFHDERALEGAIDDLLEGGFDRADISLLAGERTVIEKLGHGYDRVAELEDDLKAARVSYASKEDYGAAEGGLISGLIYVGALAGAGAAVASGGALAAVLWATALSGGAGGALGVGVARWLDHRRAERLREQLAKGGLLVWVHAGGESRERRAIDIMQKRGAEDVHAHALGAMEHVAARPPYPPLLSLFEALVPHRDRPRADV